MFFTLALVFALQLKLSNVSIMLGYIVTVIEPKKLESVILHTKGWYRKVFETHPKMSRCDERPSSTLRSRRSSPTVHLAQLLN